MPARLSAFIVWALVAASVVFWGLRLFSRPLQAPPHTVAVNNNASSGGDLARVLGEAPVAATPESVTVSTPGLASRFRLAGLMAGRQSNSRGVALIAVDGKLARAFPVGARVDGDLVLQAVSHRSATIGPSRGAAAVVLELPPLPPPQTGTLPPAGAPPAFVAPPNVPQGGFRSAPSSGGQQVTSPMTQMPVPPPMSMPVPVPMPVPAPTTAPSFGDVPSRTVPAANQ